MEFTVERWKAAAKEKYTELANWLKRQGEPVGVMAYGGLTAFTLWPLVEYVAAAAQVGQPLPLSAILTLGSIAGGVGGNLLASQIQNWYENSKNGAAPTEEDVLAWLSTNALQKEDIQPALDQMLQELDAIPQANEAMAESDWSPYFERLLAELKQIGNFPRFQAQLEGDGLIVQVGGDFVSSTNVAFDQSGQTFEGWQANIGRARDIGHIGPVIHHHAAAPSELSPADKALPRYFQRLWKRCNALPLAAMGGEETPGQDVLLEQVYIDLDTTTRIPLAEKTAEQAAIDRDGDEIPRLVRDEEKVLSALEAATETDRLVLLGDPGGGKSSFVRQLAAWLAAAHIGYKELPAEWEPLLPLLVALRDLAPRLAELSLEGKSATKQQQLLRKAVMDQWRTDLEDMDAVDLFDALPDWLDKGQVLLIFDGLDEVPVATRDRVRLAVQAIMDQHEVSRVIVTCRERSYSGDGMLPGFTTQTLAPFDEEKIRNFVRNWYIAQAEQGQLTQSEANERVDDLLEAATAADLSELAANPMLLTTMAIIHQEQVGLPKERVRLFSRAVQVLLRRWQKRKGLNVSEKLSAVLDDDRKLRTIMERLAYEAHQRQSEDGAPRGDLARKDILELLERPEYLDDIGLADEFLDYVDQRSGLLVGHGGDARLNRPALYSFPHRTFQEYLAGCYLITGRGVARQYWRHVREGDYWYLAARLGAEELLHNKQMVPNLLDLAYALCVQGLPQTEEQWRALTWSGRMATMMGKEEIARDDKPDGGKDYWKRLIDHFPAVLGSPLPAVEQAEAGRVLALLGDSRPEVTNVDSMRFCSVPAGEFWMGSAEEDEDADDDERPLHQVDIPYDYWIGRYPVSNAQYAAFVEDNGYLVSGYWPEAIAHNFWQEEKGFKGSWDDDFRRGPVDYGLPFSLENHPVVGVSWYEVLAFRRWLTERWQANGRLPEHLRVTLPSEAEWEKAVRGGLRIPSQTTSSAAGQWELLEQLVDNPQDRRRYPWGDEFDPNLANSHDSGIGRTSALGVFAEQQNPYGVQEMSGNVYEWTRSRFASYRYQANDGREATENFERSTRIVLRGGSWASSKDWLRCAARTAPGSARTPGPSSSGFGWWCPHCPPLISEASDLWISDRARSARRCFQKRRIYDWPGNAYLYPYF